MIDMVDLLFPPFKEHCHVLVQHCASICKPNRRRTPPSFLVFTSSPLIYGEIPAQEAGRFLHELASGEYTFPTGDGTDRLGRRFGESGSCIATEGSRPFFVSAEMTLGSLDRLDRR